VLVEASANWYVPLPVTIVPRSISIQPVAAAPMEVIGVAGSAGPLLQVTVVSVHGAVTA
jgi:hypothetical protein